jgi:hypothetical protein
MRNVTTPARQHSSVTVESYSPVINVHTQGPVDEERLARAVNRMLRTGAHGLSTQVQLAAQGRR